MHRDGDRIASMAWGARNLISTQVLAVGAAGRWYALGTMRTVGDMLEIHAHACPLYLVAVGLAVVAWAALTYFDAPPSAFV